jgi:anti-sigma factor RsiW
MNCQQFQKQILEFLDGALAPEERRFADGHLHRCAACRQQVKQHRKSWQWLAQLPAGQIEAAQLERMAEQAQQQGRREERAVDRRSSLPTMIRLAAAAAVLVLACWGALQLRSKDTNPADPSGQTAQGAVAPPDFLQDQELSANFDVILDLPDLEEMGDLLDLGDEELFMLQALAGV